MNRKIFKSIIAVAVAVLLGSLVVILASLYEYFGGVQEQQLQEHLLVGTEHQLAAFRQPWQQQY